MRRWSRPDFSRQSFKAKCVLPNLGKVAVGHTGELNVFREWIGDVSILCSNMVSSRTITHLAIYYLRGPRNQLTAMHWTSSYTNSPSP
jgi:hypothetical protein